MKQLEPGCRVMIINSKTYPDEIGKIYTVLRCAGFVCCPAAGAEGIGWHLSDNQGLPWYEGCLMRIDDDANLDDKETQREKSWSQ